VTSDARNERAAPAGGELEWERRFGPRVGLAALFAAAFIGGSFVLQLGTLRHSKNEADYLRSVHQHASAYAAGGILQFLALLFVAGVLWYLFRASKYRRAQTPKIALVLGIAGPVALAIVGAINPFLVKHYAAEFAALPTGSQTTQHAKDLLKGSGARTLGIVSLPAGLAFAFAMIMTNVNAMRTGLVSTFVGIIGVIGGLLFVLPLGPPQLLLFFWLISVAAVVLDRWPGGRGPAWESGEVEKWPSPRERRMAQTPQARGQGPGATRDGPEPEPEAQAPMPTRSSRKRKRKQGRKH
jgi:Domain of unknown function (DUF4386)